MAKGKCCSLFPISIERFAPIRCNHPQAMSPVTPSLSTIESSWKPAPIVQDGRLNFTRSRSLPPNLSPIKIDLPSPMDFLPRPIAEQKCPKTAPQSRAGWGKPTLKVAGKFRKSRPKTRGTSEKSCVLPDSAARKKLLINSRNLHVRRTASLPGAGQAMSTFKELYKVSPIKALISLNDEVKGKKYKRTILTVREREKVKFHYLSDNPECRQCMSKNQKRFAEFYKKNSEKMGKFAHTRRAFSTYVNDPLLRQMEYEQAKAKEFQQEIVRVKDQNLATGLKGQAVTLFNLIKLQSSTPTSSFTPTNSYKFEAKQVPEEYKFRQEDPNNQKKPDPYPLEMFNEDYIPELESARGVSRAQSCPEFVENDLQEPDEALEDVEEAPKWKSSLEPPGPFARSRSISWLLPSFSSPQPPLLLRNPNIRYENKVSPTGNQVLSPCGSCGRRQPPRKKPPSDSSKKPARKEKKQRKKALLRPNEEPSCHAPPRRPDLVSRESPAPYPPKPAGSMEAGRKKCPDCGSGQKRAPCKIPVPRKKEEDDPCAPPKPDKPSCNKKNPCYQAQNFFSTGNEQQTFQFAGKKCPDCGSGKRRPPCKIQVPAKEQEEDPCLPPKAKKTPCHKESPCNQHYKYLQPTSKQNATRPREYSFPAVTLAPAWKGAQHATAKYSFPFPEDFNFNGAHSKSAEHKKEDLSEREAPNNTPPARYSFQRPSRLDLDMQVANKNHSKMVNSSKFLEIFRARQAESRELIQAGKEANSTKSGYFIHPKDSLNEKICDAISTVPKVELAENSKQMIAKAIKRMIEPIIEKEFLKYEEVKAGK
ncbi:hypothetical protein D910_05183 [Dendroctonus ponderosae]|uniref:Uncharacterized protein n=1 Tax=Dendroctonus ponderosae TaxID=77166 RepID=U4U1Q3_DENPD|nr:hypothetical protein D910_05183 [Dendroctonus ponderosae]